MTGLSYAGPGNRVQETTRGQKRSRRVVVMGNKEEGVQNTSDKGLWFQALAFAIPYIMKKKDIRTTNLSADRPRALQFCLVDLRLVNEFAVLVLGSTVVCLAVRVLEGVSTGVGVIGCAGYPGRQAVRVLHRKP